LIVSKLDFGQIVPSRDGRWLLTRTPANSPGSGDIYAFRIGDTTPVTLVATQATEMFPALSPDGRLLAYSSTESGNPEIYVRPFPETGTAKWQVSTAGGSQPQWARSGRELFYINGKNQMVSAAIRPGAAFSVGEQRVLFSTSAFAAGGGVHSYAVSPDDRRFVMLREGEAVQQSELVLAQNWLQELKARAAR
jgi:serine/threonine-protein kinase